MNLNQLRNFKKLAELENFTQAAKALYISQPSLTNEIKSLEKELGYHLFNHVGRGVTLTKYGRQLYAVVSNSLETLDNGLLKIRQDFENDMATINIACIPTAVGTYLQQNIQKYKTHETSNIHFNIYSKDSVSILKGVQTGLYDIGISSKDEAFDMLEFTPLYDESFIAIVPPDHPLANKKRLTVDDLRDYKVHTYTPTIPIGQELIGAFSEEVFQKLRPQTDATDEITIAGEVSVTNDIGIVADTMYLQSFDLIKIPLEVSVSNTRKVYASYQKENFKIKKMNEILDFFKQNN